MTKARSAVMAILEQSSQPLSAGAVIERINLQMDQATVYRTLHYLEEHGYAESFILHCSSHGTERYYTAAAEHTQHKHWFHCEQCHSFTDLGHCTLESMFASYEQEHNIQIRTHTMYMTGICADCSKLQ